MPIEPRRRIALIDLLIVVAALALGMASLRMTLASLSLDWFRKFLGTMGHRGAVEVYVEFGFAQGVPLIVVASLTVIGLTLRPRPPSLAPLRLADRPGFILCLTAVVASVLTIAVDVSSFHFTDDGDPVVLASIIWETLGAAGHMGLGAWVALALTGRARPSPSSIDRFGYALGMAWVVLLVLEHARHILVNADVM